jgi:predicted O-methyltransferase YrrM
MFDLGGGNNDTSGCEHSVSISKVAKHSCVQPLYGQLLFRISRYFRPTVMLELGTSLGISTAYMAMGNPQGKLTTIEGCPETAANAKENFELLGLTNIMQITGSFKDVLPDLLQKLEKVDLCFIDGNHRKKPSLHYFYQCLQHFGDDSVLIMDDIHWSVEMEEAWLEIKSNPSVSITIDLFRVGLVFFKKGLSKEDFIIRF